VRSIVRTFTFFSPLSGVVVLVVVVLELCKSEVWIRIAHLHLPTQVLAILDVRIDRSISGCVVRASRNIVHGIRTAFLSVLLFAARVAATDLSVIRGVLAVDGGRPHTAAS
jgi:ABC-type cobalamin transport system permease subunit